MDLIKDTITNDKIPVIVNKGSVPKMVIFCNELPIMDEAIAKRVKIIELDEREA